MSNGVAESDLIDAYEVYSSLMQAVGHEVDESALAQGLAAKFEEKDALESLLRERDGEVDCSLDEAVERMLGLRGKLVREIGKISGIWNEVEALGSDNRALLDSLLKADKERRDAVADALLLNGHRQYLRLQYGDAAALAEPLEKGDELGELDVDALAECLQQELDKRGFGLDSEELKSLLREPKQGGRVPRCLVSLVRRIESRFRSGLVPLTDLVGDTDPDEWLENARETLLFRSHSAMHKAIAEATNLKYDCVHKALSGRKKAKRIQVAIRTCLRQWLQAAADGRDIDASDEHRAVPVEETQALVPALERLFDTKEEIYRAISKRTGIRTGSVRRYFQSNGQLKYAPLVVFRWAKRLAGGKPPVSEAETKTRTKRTAKPSSSYLADGEVRQVAFELAGRAREALARWNENRDDPDLEMAYRELRRALLVTMKEGRCVLS